MKVTEGEIGWLAGILDGEGSIVLVQNSYTRKSDGRKGVSARILMAVTDFSIVEKYTTILTGLGIEYTYVLQKYKPDNSQNWLPKINVNVHKHQSVVKLLNVVIQYLTLKQDSAFLVREFVIWKSENSKKLNNGDRETQDTEYWFWEAYRRGYAGKAKSHTRSLEETVRINSVPLRWAD